MLEARMIRRLSALVALMVLLTGVGFTVEAAGGAPEARADGSVVQQVYNTGGAGLWLHPASATIHSQVSVLMPDGTNFDVACFRLGDDVSGDSVWDYGTDETNGATGLAADFYIDTPVTQGNEPAQLQALGIPECGSAGNSSPSQPTSSSGSIGYDRSAAVAWAEQNVGHAPLIQNGGDCTWFASQSAWAGGLPQSDEWAKDSPNGVLGSDLGAMVKALIHGGYSPTDPINPTIAATNANDFVNYLVDNGLATKTPINWSDNTAGGAQLGDFIAYDWDGGSDGTIDHVAVVTGFAPGTSYPTVTQHSPAQDHRYWSWSLADNSWIQYGQDYQPQPGSSNGPPQAYLIHIIY